MRRLISRTIDTTTFKIFPGDPLENDMGDNEAVDMVDEGIIMADEFDILASVVNAVYYVVVDE